jgi:Flp pilus assembly protein TadG
VGGPGEQVSGSIAQNFCQWIVNRRRLAEGQDVGSLVHGVSLSSRGSGRLDTRLDTPPLSTRHHPLSRIAPGTAVATREKGHRLLQSFLGDQSGSYVLVLALMMPVLVGTAGLGTEVVWWLYKHKNMQSAADSGAVSAATAGSNLVVQANSVTASYGYANGVNNVTVTVNQPPSKGNYTSTPQPIEVIVTQSEPRMLSSLFGSGPVIISARAVAVPNSGTGCVLGLDPTASSTVAVSGSNNLNLII